jgi:hypothetical protein
LSLPMDRGTGKSRPGMIRVREAGIVTRVAWTKSRGEMPFLTSNA